MRCASIAMRPVYGRILTRHILTKEILRDRHDLLFVAHFKTAQKLCFEPRVLLVGMRSFMFASPSVDMQRPHIKNSRSPVPTSQPSLGDTDYEDSRKETCYCFSVDFICGKSNVLYISKSPSRRFINPCSHPIVVQTHPHDYIKSYFLLRPQMELELAASSESLALKFNNQ